MAGLDQVKEMRRLGSSKGGVIDGYDGVFETTNVALVRLLCVRFCIPPIPSRRSVNP